MPSKGGASILRFDSACNALGSISFDVPVQSLHLEDLGAGHKNLVASVGSPGANPVSTTRPQLRAIDARTGAEVWRSPVLWGTVPVNSLSYVDVKGDGVRQLAFGTTYGMYVTR
jgi:PQQ enzyme-like repeat protein